ncbi:ribonuclease HII [Saxibacter everestensis]|uniref:Ribonuclease HII n=1 Tax=Saxibacter everestensis TaxID=2909229 RepID=A0ABY8QVN1_9MICO|nr:ribonuclease HII [Brevibacteriaceae bacterium ZFBP1038]
MSAAPTLKLERSLMAEGHRLIAAVDEVGRGALAGPVSVGVVLVDVTVARSLRGVRDSKLLPPARREALVDGIRRWSVGCAVGHAGPEEIDDVGLTAALGIAGRRALGQLQSVPDVVLLDGNHDWISGRGLQLDLLGSADVDDTASVHVPPVVTSIKADMRCSSVAAASVLAKVARDAIMVESAQQFPGFGWEVNKGYGTVAHRERIAAVGPTPLHRQTWRLIADPVVGAGDGLGEDLGGGVGEDLGDAVGEDLGDAVGLAADGGLSDLPGQAVRPIGVEA